MSCTMRLPTRAATGVSRRAVAVRASAEPAISRRATFALLGAVLGGVATLGAAESAMAFKLPSQEFTGGMVVGGGSLPKSTTEASASGYSLETGIKHQGASLNRKRALLAKVKATGKK